MKKKKLIELLSLIFLGIVIGFLFLELMLNITSFIIINIKNENVKNIDSEKNNDTIIILTLGESTSADDSSWPDQLQDILYENNQNMNYKVVNKALGGTNTAMILSKLRNYIEEYDPEIVITMMGINDGWSYIYYADNPPSKIKIFFEDLKVVKLVRLIIINYKKMTLKREQIVFDGDLSNEFELINQGKSEEAEKEIIKKINKSENNEKIYFLLATIYMSRLEYNKSITPLQEVLKINPENSLALMTLGDVKVHLGKYDEAEKLYEKALAKSYDTNKDVYYNTLVFLYLESNNTKEAKKIGEKIGLSYDREISKNIEENTKYHYRLMYNILLEKNITWILMQYPNRDIDDFKNYFTEEEQKNIIFIENKKNFEENLKNSTYDQLFIDRFGFPRYNFGHCTPKGNRLIAKNVANTLIKIRN